MGKVAENGRKVKAITLLFGRFSRLFQKSKKWLKMDGKVKSIALVFGRFSPLFQKSKKWLKMDEKLRLYYSLTFWTIFAPFSKGQSGQSFFLPRAFFRAVRQTSFTNCETSSMRTPNLRGSES